jgi:hypothetical protein
MNTKKRNTTGYWALCIVSGLALTYFTIFQPEAFLVGIAYILRWLGHGDGLGLILFH